ncbi:MAG TPA: SEC-C domain-containing protein [Acidimicrobiia bacterium]|nr:SEC-C domain-containing protein [Acidimicrobiia bacterium]
MPVSPEQWAVWKRYCDMLGVSAGGGLAVLVDHELASIVEEEVETLTESVKAREAAVAAREAEVAERGESVARREHSCDWRETQIEAKRLRLKEREQRLDARQEALDILAAASQPRTPHRAKPKPGRNELCWCDSGKKYKNCHLSWDQSRNG